VRGCSAELASVCSKLSHVQESSFASGDEIPEDGGTSLLFSRRDMHAQLNAATKARGSLAEMLGERHQAYDALAAKFKEIKKANKEQARVNAELEEKGARDRDAAAAVQSQLREDLTHVHGLLAQVEAEADQLHDQNTEMADALKESAALEVKHTQQIATLTDRVEVLDRYVKEAGEEKISMHQAAIDQTASFEDAASKQAEGHEAAVIALAEVRSWPRIGLN